MRMAYQALCPHERTLIGTFEREAGQPETQPSAESDTEKSVLWLLFVFLPVNKLSSLPVFGQALIADAVAALLWPLQAGTLLARRGVGVRGPICRHVAWGGGADTACAPGRLGFSITWGLTN